MDVIFPFRGQSDFLGVVFVNYANEAVLVWAGVWRKPVRTVLIFLSLVLAFLLYFLLDGVVGGFNNLVDDLSDHRLRVQSRSDLYNGLPLALANRIAEVDGVTQVSYLSFFPAYHQDPTNFVPISAIDIPGFFSVTEVDIADEHVAAISKNRTGAIIGEDLAADRGWSVGDTIPVISTYATKEDGTRDWVFEIVGTYSWGELPSMDFWVRYDYFNGSRVAGKDRASLFFVKVDDTRPTAEISRQIDEQSLNSANPSLTRTEKEWVQNQQRQIGDLQALVSAVSGSAFFTILFVTGGMIIQSIRERAPEFAILKAIGFGAPRLGRIVVLENLSLCVAATLTGLGLAAILGGPFSRALALPVAPMPAMLLIKGFFIAFVLAILVSVAPLIKVRRISIAQLMMRG